MKFLDSEKLDCLSSMLSFVTADYRLETKVEMYSCKMVHQDKRMFKEMLKADGTKANDLKALSSPVDNDDSFPANLSPPNAASGFKNIRRTISGSSDADPDSEDGSVVLCDAINQKKLFDLIGVLNASFSDYDFSAAKGENFSKVSSFEGFDTGGLDRKSNFKVGSCTSFIRVPPGREKSFALCRVRTVNLLHQVQRCLPLRHKASNLVTVKRLIDGKYASVALKPFTAIQHKLWSLIDESIDLKACKFYTYNTDYVSDPFSEDGCTWSFNYFFYNSQLKRVLFFTCRAFNYQASVDPSAFESDWSMQTTVD